MEKYDLYSNDVLTHDHAKSRVIYSIRHSNRGCSNQCTSAYKIIIRDALVRIW